MGATSADLHVGDLHFGKVLPMPRFAAVSRAAREPEDADLLALAVAHYFGDDLCALQHRLPRLHLLAVAREQDAVERHLAPGLGREQGYFDRDAFFGAELLPAGSENHVGHGRRTLIGIGTSVK